jgi:hypothetical protein
MKFRRHLAIALATLFPGGPLVPNGFAENEATRKDEIARIFADAVAKASRPRGPELDRGRGLIAFDAKHATYEKGPHWGRWRWPEFTGDRWGMYQVEVTYVSVVTRMGMQFSIGEHKAKGYLPQTGSMETEKTVVLDRVYVPDTKTYAVSALTGDDSNNDTFRLLRVDLRPAPEGDGVAQDFDGGIILPANKATTFSRRMRFEPKPEKNCLGFWTETGDWAEWLFSVHEGGRFTVQLHHGCGPGNGGSEVEVWINDKKHAFTVADTGGFQSWKAVDLGVVELTEGDHRVVITPVSKAKSAVLDVQKLVLVPQG